MSEDKTWKEVLRVFSHQYDDMVAIKWLLTFLMEKKFNSEEPVCDSHEIEIIPPEMYTKIMEKPYFIKMLGECLDLTPPNEENNHHWTIPQYIASSKESRKTLFYNVQRLSDCQWKICKICKSHNRYLLKHLSKSKICMDHYTKSEVDELKNVAKMKRKRKARLWQQENKDKLASEKSDRYEKNKANLKKKYEDNKAAILQQRATYYQKNKQRINVSKKIRRQKEMEGFVAAYNQNQSESEDSENEDSEAEERMESPDDI